MKYLIYLNNGRGTEPLEVEASSEVEAKEYGREYLEIMGDNLVTEIIVKVSE